jgi:hypothetical protein
MMMKRVIMYIAFMMLCLVHMAGYTQCQRSDCKGLIELDEKFYVQLNQIRFSENKIYIQIEDITYETPAIHADDEGYFIEKVASSGNCAWYEWECPRDNCHFCNLRGLDYKCRVCNHPISQKKHKND